MFSWVLIDAGKVPFLKSHSLKCSVALLYVFFAGGDRQGFRQAEFYSRMGEELGVTHGQSDG